MYMIMATIKISDENWKLLIDLKVKPGEKFNDVITKVLDKYDSVKSDNIKPSLSYDNTLENE